MALYYSRAIAALRTVQSIRSDSASSLSQLLHRLDWSPPGPSVPQCLNDKVEDLGKERKAARGIGPRMAALTGFKLQGLGPRLGVSGFTNFEIWGFGACS